MKKLGICILTLGLCMLYTGTIAADLDTKFAHTVFVTGFLGAITIIAGVILTAVGIEAEANRK